MLTTAYTNNEFDLSMISSAAQADIDEAVVWSAQNDQWPFLRALKPHSRLNSPTGTLKLIRLAIQRGSKSILNNTLRNELSAKFFQQHASLVIKEALHAEHVYGIQWLLNNKSFFGIKNDHFYFILTGWRNYLTASKNAVAYLTSAIPTHEYDWLYMANECAEKGDIDRCLLYLRQTPDNLFERESCIQKTIKKALRYGQPSDYAFLLAQWETLRSTTKATIVNIPQLFAVVLEHSDPQNAIEALLEYCGGNHDFSSLGTQYSQKIEHHISLAQKKNIQHALEPSDGVSRNRKM